MHSAVYSFARFAENKRASYFHRDVAVESSSEEKGEEEEG